MLTPKQAARRMTTDLNAASRLLERMEADG